MHDHNKNKEPALSIIIPVFNEEENLEPLYEKILQAMERIGESFEIVLVDDGSEDDSLGKIRALSQKDERIRYISFEKNCGQSSAMDAGFKAAVGRIVVTMDADLQNDPADIRLLLEKIDEADAVCGVRVGRSDTFVKRASSWIANRVRDLLSGDRVRDTGCTLKAFRRPVLEDLKLYTGMHRFLPTLLRFSGYRVIEIEVSHHPRFKGETKYGIFDRALPGLIDLFVVCWMKRRWIRYKIKEEK